MSWDIRVESNPRDVVSNSTAVSEPQPTKRIRPLGDRVLVRVKTQEEVVVNGVYIPDSAVEKPLEGEVVEVGNGKIVNGERISVDVKKGQHVYFGKYSGNEISVNGEKLLLLQESELHAVEEDF